MKHQKDEVQNLLDDPYLKPFEHKIEERKKRAEETEKELTQNKNLTDFASGHEYFGLHKDESGWVFREWAPNATEIYLVGDFSAWEENEDFKLTKIDENRGVWEQRFSYNKLNHKDFYKLHVYWDGGDGERIPAYARRVVQDPETKLFAAQVWDPDTHYEWENKNFKPNFSAPIIYETHIGMAQEKEGIGTYEEFRKNILPRIVEAGYNTIQIMALMEHPFYGSFGYQVSSFFAPSFRFGTPEELKKLVDEAHKNGLAVIMDLVHSHAVKNALEGLSMFDGTQYQYFHDGERGVHSAWDSRCFNYGKTEVIHFLLSNCQYWIDEFNMDGFRFDGITSMLYKDHGLGKDFGSYENYFDESVDEDAVTYLILANKLIHTVKPHAITIAEDVSGMPGVGAPTEEGGLGFDYRLSLGTPDYWFKLVKNTADEYWDVDEMYHKLTDRRPEEKTIDYVECHDQAIVGSKTMAFELMDADMYDSMEVSQENLVVDRGIALHKMMRLATIAACGGGYLNFMGNEFGHPEWIDFPREGNDWSFKHARRQWSLRDNPNLKYHYLADFDKDMINLIKDNHIVDYKLIYSFSHRKDQILAFQRKDFIFIFNFHPTKAEADYLINLPEGKYELILNSDDQKYGGHGRVEPNQVFETFTENGNKGIKLYIPNRTALVLRNKE